jgi:predicted dehydrogenase
MIEASRENGVLLMEALKNTFLPNFKAIGDNLHKIGKVRRYFSSYCQYSSHYDTYKRGEHTNTFDPSFSNGSLMDIGIYCLFPLVYYFGVPKEIRANATMLGSGIDGNGSILLKYEDMDGVIIYSKITDSKLPSEIQGEKGNIIIDRINLPSSVKIVYRNGEVEDITQPQLTDIMCYEIREFMDLVERGKTESAINTHRLSLEVHGIMEEARRQIGLVLPADKK